MDRVKSGIFIMPFHPPGKSLSQCHEERNLMPGPSGPDVRHEKRATP